MDESLFGSLPRELRDQIYLLVMQPGAKYGQEVGLKDIKHHNQLTRVCRQFRAETLQLFWAMHHITFEDDIGCCTSSMYDRNDPEDASSLSALRDWFGLVGADVLRVLRIKIVYWHKPNIRWPKIIGCASKSPEIGSKKCSPSPRDPSRRRALLWRLYGLCSSIRYGNSEDGKLNQRTWVIYPDMISSELPDLDARATGEADGENEWRIPNLDKEVWDIGEDDDCIIDSLLREERQIGRSRSSSMDGHDGSEVDDRAATLEGELQAVCDAQSFTAP
jgi:hypothetical protein